MAISCGENHQPSLPRPADVLKQLSRFKSCQTSATFQNCSVDTSEASARKHVSLDARVRARAWMSRRARPPLGACACVACRSRRASCIIIIIISSSSSSSSSCSIWLSCRTSALVAAGRCAACSRRARSSVPPAPTQRLKR